MLRIIFLGVIGYILYKLVFRFLLPLAKLVTQTHHSINEMKQKMNQRPSQQAKEEIHFKEPNHQVEGDYIDFEELK